MAREREIPVVFAQLVWARQGGPAAGTGSAGASLEVTVIFTDNAATVWALKKATQLARDLNGRIRLLVPQVVPYAAPLASPPVLLEFSERRFRELAAQQQIETRVEICLCREIDDVLAQRLPPEAVIVVGARRTWWPVASRRLARKLQRRGHHVVIASPEPHRPAGIGGH